MLIILAVTLLALAVISPKTIAHASDNIHIIVDGVRLTFDGQQPVILNGRTLVPIRGVFEQLGFDVSWNAEAHQAILARTGYIIIITIGSDVFTTNGERHLLDVTAQIISNSTMLPIRAVLESVGYELNWDSGTRTANIVSEAAQIESQAQATPIPRYQLPHQPRPRHLLQLPRLRNIRHILLSREDELALT